jgi:hypothetical protein
MRTTLLAAIAATAMMALGAASASAATSTIDNLSAWEDYPDPGYAAYLSPDHARTVFAQTVTAPLGGRSALTSFAFPIQGREAMRFKAEVRRWDGDRPIGPALWVSETHTVCDCDGYVVHPFSPAGVEVDPGEQIVLILTTVRDTSTEGFARVGTWTRYAGGDFWTASPATVDEILDGPWIENAGGDLAFRATFFAPDETLPPPSETPDPSVGQGAPPTQAPSTDPASDPAAPAEPTPAPVGSPLGAVIQPSPAAVQSSRRCTVPKLVGVTLPNARRRLARNGCALGTVKGHGPRVRRQGARAGRRLNRGSAVSVTVG